MMRKHAGRESDFGKRFGDSDDGFELTMKRVRVVRTCTRTPEVIGKKGLTGQSWG